MYSVADRLTPQTYHALARAVYAEMALAGVTAVGEFHYLHHAPGGTPYADPNAMGEALIEAAAEAGIRITLLDTAYLSSGFGQPPTSHQLRFSDGSADAWAERCSVLKDRDHARIGAAVHSVRAVPAASWRPWPAGPRNAGPRSMCTCPSRPPRTTRAARPTGARPPNCSPSTVSSGRAPPASTTPTSPTGTSP